MQDLQQQIKVYWKINWLRRTVIAVVAFSLLLVLLPLTIQYGITHQLKKMGATEASIQDVDLNLFAGTFDLKQLELVSGKNEAARIDQLTIDLRMLDLFSRRIIVNNFQIKGVKANISLRKSGELSINGLLLPQGDKTATKDTGDKESGAPVFGINRLSIKDAEITYQETDFSQHSYIQSINLTNVKSWDAASIAALDLNLKLNNAPLNISAQLKLFDDIPHFKGNLFLDSLSLSSYEKFYRDHLKRLQASVSVDTDFDITMTESVTLAVTGAVDIANLELGYRQIKNSTKSINWKGDVKLSQKGALSVAGDVEIEQSMSRDMQQNYLISSIQHLKITNLQNSAMSTRFDQLVVQKSKLIDLTDPEKKLPNHFVSISKLDLQGLELQTEASKLSIRKINLEKPELTVTLDTQKQLEHLKPLLKTIDSMTATSQTEQQPEGRKSGKPFVIEISQFKLMQPGSVSITDNSVSPVYKSTLHLNQIEINNISSLKPADFTLALKQGDYTDINVKGDGLLFNPTEKFQLKANIKQLDLPPVTPYTSNIMGYGMKSGVIDSDIQLKLEKREIDSVIDLKIDSIEVVETDKKTAQQISSASGMSIDLAASTLKDSNNIIDLKLPVKGNIDKPDFDLSLIINKAMGIAMKSATLTYLKHTLQPFGSLISLVELARAAADHISLPPVLFKTNSLELKEQQQELIDKVLKVLKDRPGVKIKACGVSALEDRTAINHALIEIEKNRLIESQKNLKKEKLEKVKKEIEEIRINDEVIHQKMKELADNRAAKVKSYLLEKGKLESKRILNCLSSSNTEKDSKPSVELQI